MTDNVKVGILFPWTGLPKMDRGSARRVVPIARMLSDHFSSVEVLSPGHSATIVERKVTYEYVQERPVAQTICSLAYRLFEGITYHYWHGRVSLHERHQLWHFFRPYFQPALRGAVRRLVSRVDVVILKCPFWSAILPRGDAAKPVILSLHDVLSTGITQPWLRSKVRGFEIDACRRADRIVCCIEADVEQICAAGFHPTYVPHGIDLTAKPIPDTPVGPEFERIAEHKKRGGIICFFVGSSHKPNLEAVRDIGTMSGELLDDPGILFVLAGSCCGKMFPARNLIMLGPVEEGVLEWIYSVCDIVLSPLRSGTGSSLKTLEAMAKKKILVTSSVGARGYHITNERDAILSDDFSRYPDILRKLAADIALRDHLSAGGWEFVQAFDCQTVYLPIVDLVKSLHKGRP